MEKGEITERIANKLASVLEQQGLKVLYDPHQKEKGNKIVSRIGGGRSCLKDDKLAYLDIAVIDPNTDEAFLLAEIEERGFNPKKLLGDIFAVLLGDRITYGDRELKISSRTSFVVGVLVHGEDTNGCEKYSLLETKINKMMLASVEFARNCWLNILMFLPFKDEDEVIEKLLGIISKNLSADDLHTFRVQLLVSLSSAGLSLDQSSQILQQCYSLLKNRKLVEDVARELGLNLSGFEMNQDLELYYDVLKDDKDLGFISKGWGEPGFRVGNIITLQKKSAVTFEKKKNEFLEFCATRGVACYDHLIEGGVEVVLLDNVYEEGFNASVFSQMLQVIGECEEKLWTMLNEQSHVSTEDRK